MSEDRAQSSRSALPNGASSSRSGRGGRDGTVPGRSRSRWARPIAVAALIGLPLGALSACNTAPNGTPPPAGSSGVTVTGTVDDIAGTPLPQAHVLIGTKTAVTGLDGTFTVSGVATPYDLIVFDTADSFVYDYQGLTTTAPVVGVDRGLTAPNAASLSGDLGSSALGTSQAVILPGGDRPADGTVNISAGGGPAFGPTQVTWGGAAMRSTTLYAVSAVLNTTTKLPDSYTGYGELSLALQDGVDLTNLAVPLQAIPKQNNGTLSGAFAPPDSSYSMAGGGLVLRFGSATSGAIIYLKQALTNDAFSNAPIPLVSGAPIGYALLGQAHSATGAVTTAMATAAASSSDTLTLPKPPQLLTPASGATTFKTSTVFSWESHPGSAYVLLVHTSGGAMAIVTDGTSTTLPDLSPLGLQLPTNVSYTFNVLSLGPVASVEGVARDLWYRLETLGVLPNLDPNSGPVVNEPLADGWLTNSASTSLTLQP